MKDREATINDLVRYVKVNPKISNPITETVCKPIDINLKNISYQKEHYFKQPLIKSIKINKSKGLAQTECGGFRLVDIENLLLTEEEAWSLGFLWIDYITSWNDLKIKELEKNNWKLDFNSVVPWRLNPLEKNYFSDITFLSEKPIGSDFIVHRSYSDHGRIGSI